MAVSDGWQYNLFTCTKYFILTSLHIKLSMERLIFVKKMLLLAQIFCLNKQLM